MSFFVIYLQVKNLNNPRQRKWRDKYINAKSPSKFLLTGVRKQSSEVLNCALVFAHFVRELLPLSFWLVRRRIMFGPLKKSAKFIRPVNISSCSAETSTPERLKPTPTPRRKTPNDVYRYFS